MIEVKILLDNINYDSLADVLVPLVAGHLGGEKGGVLGEVLAKNPDTAAAMARTLLRTMSQEKKDEMVVQLMGKHRDKLLQAGRSALSKHGIGAELCDLSARKV
ncbi:MAG: hypothetical protein E7426_07635 [Ruminococcaceae bacterium]|jgi:hypothetical protein|nr:hypothetical protein [Oscillospiraceae bacterium]